MSISSQRTTTTGPGPRTAGERLRAAVGAVRRALSHRRGNGTAGAWRAESATDHGGLPTEPSGLLAGFRRWSPGFMPPLLGALLLFLAAQLAAKHGPGTPLVGPGVLVPLFLFYLVAGLLYGSALYFAPTLALWLVALLGGVVLYLFATAAFLAGTLGLVVVGVLLAALGLVYVRRRWVNVPDHQVRVTSLGGAYLRTLGPGSTVLLPGERIAATVETSERTLTCPTRQVRIESAEGVVYVARASAVIAYRLRERAAHRAVLASRRWEEALCDVAGRALGDSLADWAIHMLDDEAPPEELFIARSTLQRMRDEVRPWGVRLESVKVQGVKLLPESETIPAEWSVPVQRVPAPRVPLAQSTSLSHAPSRPAGLPYTPPLRP